MNTSLEQKDLSELHKGVSLRRRRCSMVLVVITLAALLATSIVHRLLVESQINEIAWSRHGRVLMVLEKILFGTSVTLWVTSAGLLLLSRETRESRGLLKLSVLVVGGGLFWFCTLAISMSAWFSETRHRKELLWQVGMGVARYADEHAGQLPPAGQWCEKVWDAMEHREYTLKEDHFRFTSDVPGDTHVGFNSAVSGRVLGDLPKSVVILFESNGAWNLAGGWEMLQERRRTVRCYRDFVYVFLADGGVYQYWFGKNGVADPTTGTYKPIRWEP